MPIGPAPTPDIRDEEITRLRKVVMDYRASECPNCDESKRVNVGLLAENTTLKRKVEALENGREA